MDNTDEFIDILCGNNVKPVKATINNNQDEDEEVNLDKEEEDNRDEDEQVNQDEEEEEVEEEDNRDEDEQVNLDEDNQDEAERLLIANEFFEKLNNLCYEYEDIFYNDYPSDSLNVGFGALYLFDYLQYIGYQ